MRTHSTIDLLRSEARRRPHVQAWIDDLDNMTIEDIQNLPVPLPWYRDALLKMKGDAAEAATIEVMINENVITGFTEDVPGRIIRWTAMPEFVRMTTGLIEIDTDRLIFLTDAGGMWFETMYVASVPASIAGKCVDVGPGTKSSYVAMFKAELLARNPLPDCVIDLSNQGKTAGGRLAGLGVRIG